MKYQNSTILSKASNRNIKKKLLFISKIFFKIKSKKLGQQQKCTNLNWILNHQTKHYNVLLVHIMCISNSFTFYKLSLN